MSATPRPWELEPDNMIVGNSVGGTGEIVYWAGDVEGCRELTPLSREDLELIVQRVNAFDALLAVAKAAMIREGESTYLREERTDEAIAALDAAHPGWREWA